MGVTKIATCCYCGTRAALVLRGKDKHELTCSNCGAPLRVLKMLPKHPDQIAAPTVVSSRPAKRQRTQKRAASGAKSYKKRRKTKSFGKRMMSELWDVVEDVVDEIFD